MKTDTIIFKYNFKKIAPYKNLIIYCILALITFIVYWPSLYYPFQFDDLPNILNYANLKTVSLKSLYFSNSRWLCTWLNSLLYHNYQSDPFICRLINLFIHISTGALVFWLIYRFKTKLQKNTFYIATLTTLLFLLHPVQTQTICYVIQGQLEGLASLFILGAVFGFYYYVQTPKFLIKYLSLFILFTCILFATSTKEIAIITPFLILLIDWFLIASGKIDHLKKRFWMHVSCFTIIFSIYIYYLKPTFFWKLITCQQAITCNNGNLLTTGATTISQYQFLISQFKVILHYLAIFIWPLNICVEYDWQINHSFWDFSCLMPLLTLSTIVLITGLLLKKNPTHPLGFGITWFLICILPRSSIIASGELLVDYKTYLASIGWLFVLTYLINLLINKITKPNFLSKAQALSLILLTITITILTKQRNLVWSSNRLFWQDIIIKAPKKARGFNNYGMALVEEGLYDQAIFYFKHAIYLNSKYNANDIYWDSYQNLANVYAMTNQIDLAIDIVKKGLTINPEIAELHNNLGALFIHKQNLTDGIKHLQLALKLKPHLEQALYSLGKTYLEMDRPDLAWPLLHKGCIETHLDRVNSALLLYSEASIKLHKMDAALWALQKILNRHPQNITALFNLGGVYFFTQKYPDAINCYQQILAIEPNNQVAANKLAFLTQNKF